MTEQQAEKRQQQEQEITTGQAVGGCLGMIVIVVIILAFLMHGSVMDEQADRLVGLEWTRGAINHAPWVEVMTSSDVPWAKKQQVAALIVDDMLADPEVRSWDELKAKGEKGLQQMREKMIESMLERAAQEME